MTRAPVAIGDTGCETAPANRAAPTPQTGRQGAADPDAARPKAYSIVIGALLAPPSAMRCAALSRPSGL